MKNAVLCDIKPSSYLTGDTKSPLQTSASYCYVILEVLTAVTTKDAVFSDIKPSSYFTGDTLVYRLQLVNAM
jgi:hypothetical protein